MNEYARRLSREQIAGMAEQILREVREERARLEREIHALDLAEADLQAEAQAAARIAVEHPEEAGE